VELSVTLDAGRECNGLPALAAGIERRLRMSCGPGATLEVQRDVPPRLTLRITLLDPREARHEASPAN
jgi:hypothetical protein